MALPNEAPAAAGSGPRRGTSSAMLSKPTAQLRLLKSKQVGGLLEALGQLGRGHQAVHELYEAYAERLAERKSDLESAIEAQRDSMRSAPMSDIM